MSIDPSRFSSGIKCARVFKENARIEGDFIVPTREYKKSFHFDQILIETPDYWLLTPERVHGVTSKLYDVADTTWVAPTAFAIAANKAVPAAQTRLIDALVVNQLTSYDFDKVLDVLVAMGRIDVAFELVCQHLELPAEMPTSWVLFERFAHRSPMIVMTSATTAVRPEGSIKSVIEHMFILSGGWHGRRMYRDPAAATEVMASVRNPWKIAGVRPGDARLDVRLHSVYRMPSQIETPAGDFWTHDGVLYLADTDGAVLPYWFTSAEGTEVTPAWDETFRRKTASHLGLSIMLARNIERFIGASANASRLLT